MSASKRPYRLGDFILDTYLPGASDAKREEARENLRALAALLVRIDERQARETRITKIRANRGPAVDSDIPAPTPDL